MKRYVEECLAGKNGARGKDFNMRWIASLVAEVHRILMRGGLFMYPKDTKDPAQAGPAAPALRGEPDGDADRAGRRRGVDRPRPHPRGRARRRCTSACR